MSDLLNSDDENRVFSVNAMEETLSSVLQEQAFMFAEYEDALDIAATPTPPYQYARIEFDGPCSGRLGLVFPHSLLSELIGNMLGLEIDEIEQEDVPDALMDLPRLVPGPQKDERQGDCGGGYRRGPRLPVGVVGLQVLNPEVGPG